MLAFERITSRKAASDFASEAADFLEVIAASARICFWGKPAWDVKFCANVREIADGTEG
ncbi:MAG: hypothetical protein ACI4J8_08345 [Oscillospiraceae bacterium]